MQVETNHDQILENEEIEEFKVQDQGQVVVEEDKKKKKKLNYRFKPEMITDPKKGIIFLYEALGKTNFDSQANFNEIKELDKYLKLIEEWHYYTVPKYDFQYFTERCQKFGNQGALKNQIQQLRKAHKEIIPLDFLKRASAQNGLNEDPEQQFDMFQPIVTPSNPDFIEDPQLPDQQVYDHIQNQINRVEIKTPFKTPNNKKILIKPRTQNKLNQQNLSEAKEQDKKQPIDTNLDLLDDLFGQIEEFEQIKAQNKKIKE